MTPQHRKISPQKGGFKTPEEIKAMAEAHAAGLKRKATLKNPLSVRTLAAFSYEKGASDIQQEILKSAEAVDAEEILSKQPKAREGRKYLNWYHEHEALDAMREHSALCVAKAEARINELEGARFAISERENELRKDLFKAHEQLAAKEAECQQLRKAQQWISVEDRLPNIGEYVIGYRPMAESHDDDVITILKREYEKAFIQDLNGIKHSFERNHHVSHWKPLPQAPEFNQHNKKEG